MQVTLNIPDEKKALIIDTICTRFNYAVNVTINVLDSSGNITYDASTGQPITEVTSNPVSKGVFSKDKIIEMIKTTVKGYKQQEKETEMYTSLRSELDDIENIDIT